MMDEKPPAGVEPTTDRLAKVSVLLDSVTEALVQRVIQLRAGDTIKPAEARALTTELRKWAMIAFEAQERIDKRIKDAGSIVHEPSIDFDAARAAIGRRLARLRAAFGAGGVPGGPDGA